MDEEIIASLSARIKNEPYSKKLGMRLLSLQPGRAVIEMVPGEDAENIFGMTHGGAIFSLIDEAFQASCNSHGRIAVALNVNVTYHKSPVRGSTLRAESIEIHITNRTAAYEIKVTDDNDTLIASGMALAYIKSEKLPFADQI